MYGVVAARRALALSICSGDAQPDRTGNVLILAAGRLPILAIQNCGSRYALRAAALSSNSSKVKPWVGIVCSMGRKDCERPSVVASLVVRVRLPPSVTLVERVSPVVCATPCVTATLSLWAVPVCSALPCVIALPVVLALPLVLALPVVEPPPRLSVSPVEVADPRLVALPSSPLQLS